MPFHVVLAFVLMLVLLVAGILQATVPERWYRWRKALAESRGYVMVDSPAPVTIRVIRLWGIGMILFALVGAIGFATTL